MAELNVTPAGITDPAPATATHVVVAAWHCEPCEVQGRSLPDVDVACWNCGGPVTVTARPSIRIDELESGMHPDIPRQRTAEDADRWTSAHP